MNCVQVSTSESPVIQFPIFQTDTPLDSSTAGYEATRFNAMKHGILSRLVVLAHEDHAEFDDLLAALIEEHRPAGMTERHLIEELATIIWRKRRVLLAEGREDQRGAEKRGEQFKVGDVIGSTVSARHGRARRPTCVTCWT
jgi:hypothetical protein